MKLSTTMTEALTRCTNVGRLEYVVGGWWVESREAFAKAREHGETPWSTTTHTIKALIARQAIEGKDEGKGYMSAVVPAKKAV